MMHKKKEKQQEQQEKQQEPDQLKLLQQEKEQLQDKYVRLAAEFENFKKRMSREKEQFLQFCNEDILQQLLPTIDDFDRAQEAAKAHEGGEAFSKGVEMILKQLHKLLIDNGVEKIKTDSEAFNPNLHEAIGTTETDEQPEDTITEEVSPGYTLNGRLLRAAKVKIARKKTQTEEKKKEDKEDDTE